MSTTVQPSTSKAQSTFASQRVRLVLEADIFQDADGGPDSLIVTTDQLACEPVSSSRLLGMVAKARAQLDAIAKLAEVFEAEDTIRAILAEHDAHLEEWDTATLDPKLRDKFVALAMVTKGRPTFVVPKGQDPIERAAVLAGLVSSLEQQEWQA